MESLNALDVIEANILLRQPLKSLVRCVYVCKRWNSIICAEEFKTNYLQRRGIDPGRLSLFRSICSTERRQHTVSAPIRGWICIQSSTRLRLYNPCTAEPLHLPVLVRHAQRYPDRCLFGYDEANDVFKVLGFIRISFEVYTVRSGGEGSWRPIACEYPHTYHTPFKYFNLDSEPPLSVTNALCKGGVLYYVAITLSDLTTTIMSFDLNSEEFTVNHLPEGFIVDNWSTMVNYNGKVALVNNSATELQITGGFQICVRNEDSGQWELEHVVIPCWRTINSWESLFSFVGTIGSGELVFTTVAASLAEPEYVFYYKIGSGISRIFTLEGANKGAYHYSRACLNHFECLFRTT